MFDYQQVKLVGITKPEAAALARKWEPIHELDFDAEDLISYCARVSNPKNQGNFNTAGKLLKYLMDNQHWSPFEMVHVVMEIKTTRDIGRQILRHRSFSFQEFSQRYAEVLEPFQVREARLQDPKNRQNSIDVEDDSLQLQWTTRQMEIAKLVNEHYMWAINAGIAKEQARAILPEGMTMSTMYMSGTLRSWVHYCMLRMANGTQKEHQDIAEKTWVVLKEQFPFLNEID